MQYNKIAFTKAANCSYILIMQKACIESCLYYAKELRLGVSCATGKVISRERGESRKSLNTIREQMSHRAIPRIIEVKTSCLSCIKCMFD